MKTDANGLSVAVQRQDTVVAWNATQQAFLSHSAATPEHLGAVLQAEPDFALAHATKGIFYMLLGRSELWPTARLALDQARAVDVDPVSRDAHYVRLLDALLSGQFRRAATETDTILRRWPQDALGMKLGQAIRFMLGDAQGMRRVTTALLPVWKEHPMRGYLMGCHAFALEETGDYAAAESHGHAGLELRPDDAWGLHAVAHVHDMTGRAEDGVRWLAGRSSQWAHCNNFGFHVWWHLALFHLDRGAYSIALELYDRKVRSTHSDDFRDTSNAASLLFRLEAEGVDVGERWEELADIAAARVGDGALVFADLHYQLALIRSGRAAEADALALRMTADAGIGDHDQHEVADLCGCAIVRGLNAFRTGDYTRALDMLRRGLVDLPRSGGSHAQRDVFHRITVEAALRSGRLDTATSLLLERKEARGAPDGYHERRMDGIELRRREISAAGIAAQ